MNNVSLMFLVLIVASCSYVNEYLGLPDDNFAEEIAEEVIEAKTGMDIDLTPGSPE